MNNEICCEFCNKKFLYKSNLIKHQKTAKFCLNIQDKVPSEIFKCEFCDKEYNRKDVLEEHLIKCKTNENKVLKRELNRLSKLNQKYTKNLEEYKYDISNLEKKIIEFEIYKNLYEEEKIKVHNLEAKNIKLENDIKELAYKAIENAGTKNTTINNKNQIYNSLQPLTNDYMKEQTKYLTYNNIKNGAHGIAHFASNHTFKDRVACSDKSRLNFVFKNDSDNIIKDPEGVEITKRFIEINKEEIVRLVNEYLNFITNELMDESTSGDMYKFWADKREEFIAIRSAVMKGNVSDNEESYNEFKKNFLSALSNLVPR
jgi:hypothetical protein